MKKRSFVAIVFATLFLGATLSVFSADNTTSVKTNNGTNLATGGHTIGANDVTGTFVPD